MFVRIYLRNHNVIPCACNRALDQFQLIKAHAALCYISFHITLATMLDLSIPDQYHQLTD